MEEETNRRKEKDPVKLQAEVSNNLETVLNKQGYSFQYSVLRLAEKLLKARESRWKLEITELPGAFNNNVSHIDFILRQRGLFLIGECKRVDPARGYWCFAKTPYTHVNSFNNLVQFDKIRCFSELPQFNSSTRIENSERDVMDLGLEVKSGEKGDGTGNDKSGINKAVSQVLQGASAYINYLADEGKKLKHLEVDSDYIFIPAVFTTARIFTTTADLGNASLENGYLPKDSVKAEEKDWIWFNHNRSLNLSHHVRFNYNETNASNLYYQEFTRSIAIVGPNGIENFFKANLADWLD